jgi:myo-inositol catabolism protein IolC
MSILAFGHRAQFHDMALAVGLLLDTGQLTYAGAVPASCSSSKCGHGD